MASIIEDEYVEQFVLWLTIFTVLYTILGWVVGEKGYKMCYLDFTSLRHALCSFIIGLCLSSLFTGLELLNEKCTSILKLAIREVLVKKPKHQYRQSQRGECVYDAQS